MPEQILVFKRERFGNLPASDFIKDTRLINSLINISEFIDKDEAEYDKSYKQFIVYCVIKHQDSVFQYTRSAHGGEKRIFGFRSIGVGGHVSQVNNSISYDTILASRDRELREELTLPPHADPELIGLINDDSNEIVKNHFGVIFKFNLNTPDVKPGELDLELIDHGFVSLSNLSENQHEYEPWSQIIIRRYFCT